jgi:hypothetical protein
MNRWIMSSQEMNSEEYKAYISSKLAVEEYIAYTISTISFIEMWKPCYYTLLSNPQYSEKSMKELRELSWKHAEGLKRDTRHYLEGNYPQSD